MRRDRAARCICRSGRVRANDRAVIVRSRGCKAGLDIVLAAEASRFALLQRVSRSRRTNMAVMTLPAGTVDYVKLASLLVGDDGGIPAPHAPLVVRVEEGVFLTASAIAWLCAFCVDRKRNGKAVRFEGTRRALGYLARIDLLRHAGTVFDETFERHDETGRFLSLRLVEAQESVLPTVHDICELVAHHFDNAREFLPALEWATYEIIGNVFNHAESSTPAVVYAQNHSAEHRLRIAIADQGRGLRASLSESYELFGHGDAIDKALLRGVTRNPLVGQGNGMAGTLAITEANGGTMRVATGDVQFEKASGSGHRFRKCGWEVPGTTVSLALDTRRPVSLRSTFIGDTMSTYLQSLAGKVDFGDPVVVLEEVVHTGGGEPARALRHRLEAVLDDSQTVVKLDFTGIQSAASSFLDELLGRLCARCGRDGLRGRLVLIGANEDLLRMANVVTEQRWADLE
jgi:hypothetical protein